MPDITDDQLKDLVKQAFVFLDKEYFDSIGEKLAARMVMRVEGEQSNSARLKELEQLVSSGCSATIAVVLENRSDNRSHQSRPHSNPACPPGCSCQI